MRRYAKPKPHQTILYNPRPRSATPAPRPSAEGRSATKRRRLEDRLEDRKLAEALADPWE